METETQSQTTKIKFVPVHQTREGIVTGELRTDGIFDGQFICNIEESNAKEIIKRNNMHDELIEAIKMEIWAIENGEYEAQKQGKPRMITRKEKLVQILKQAEQK